MAGQIDAVLGDTRNSDDLANAEKSEKCVSSLLSMIGQLGGPLEARWGRVHACTACTYHVADIRQTFEIRNREC